MISIVRRVHSIDDGHSSITHAMNRAPTWNIGLGLSQSEVVVAGGGVRLCTQPAIEIVLKVAIPVGEQSFSGVDQREVSVVATQR